MNGNFCRYCGKALEPGAKFCTGCGQSAEAPFQQAPQNPNPQQNNQQNGNQYFNGNPQQGYYMPPQPKERQLNTGLLIFSIITICFGSCSLISLILGIVALVYVIQAKNANSDEEEAEKLKAAKKFNIIGVVIIAIAALLYIGIVVIGGVFTALFAEEIVEEGAAILPFIFR